MQHMRLLRCLSVLFVASLFAAPAIFAQEDVVIDAHAPATPFPHFWEGTFGSGRAILSLRESYRNDLRAVKQVADFNYVRFHAIFHDEIGVYNEDAAGQSGLQLLIPSIRSMTACWPIACGPSLKSVSCRANSPPTPTRCIPSGTSPSSRRPRASIAGTT